MRLPSTLRVISFISLVATTALSISLSKPGCPEKCGNITIPYPFGIGAECSANSSFIITCKNSTNPPTPFLSSIKMGVVNISLSGAVIVSQPVSPVNCSDEPTTRSLPISLKGSPFTISARYNVLAVFGCKNSVWLRPNKTTVGGCMAVCEANSTDVSCNGVNCCQTTISVRLQELQYSYQSIRASNSGLCGYVFPVDMKWLQKEDYRRYEGLVNDMLNPFDEEFGFVPLVLEWEFGHTELFDGKSYQVCRSQINYQTDEYASSVAYCTCPYGYEGNPYIERGCIQRDECFENQMGDYYCKSGKSRVILPFIIIASVLGAMFLLMIIALKSTKLIRKKINANRQSNFFKRNGGLLLEQQQRTTDNGLEKTRLFSSKELAQATEDYNENRILGRGGQGTVYKGMLTDGRIVAVKKSKKVDEGDLEVFINEVVVLSQVNHRNVVKLLGCCLETEVPLLVYEFIPNGTLFQHIHEPSEDFPLTWVMRVRITREVAGALAYLHSSASAPIYHRDIKSTNILLDDKYRAKVADFGTSKSISVDQTHLTTRVVGTFGYLDPEYFRSSQFTDKSDVYSFGVVMVELLTGEKAISATRVEEERGLAMHFLHSMEENQLFDILDARVLEEGEREEIVAIAELARRCLQLNGRSRPTMKEVAVELEGIQMSKEGSNCLQNQDKSREGHFESFDFSSVSESMNLESITPYSPDAERPLLDEL